MRRSVQPAIAGCLVLGFLSARAPQPIPASLIVGTWHGTSICVDPQTDKACHDEEVIYDVDSPESARGPVQMRADKVVAGVRESMGTLRLTYDSTTHRWSTDLTTTRVRARWTFELQGDVLAGTLTELPSNRLMRRVTARRSPAR